MDTATESRCFASSYPTGSYYAGNWSDYMSSHNLAAGKYSGCNQSIHKTATDCSHFADLHCTGSVSRHPGCSHIHSESSGSADHKRVRNSPRPGRCTGAMNRCNLDSSTICMPPGY